MEAKREKTRFSDEELQEFRVIIQKKLEEAREGLKLLTEAYTTQNANDTNDTSPSFKILEEGSQVLSKEENGQLAARQQKFIRDLENDLIRIENKTYGVCRVTGKLISKDRLRIVLGTPFSISLSLSAIRDIKPLATGGMLVYWGIKLATSARSTVEIIRESGLNIIISPTHPETLMEKFNEIVSNTGAGDKQNK